MVTTVQSKPLVRFNPIPEISCSQDLISDALEDQAQRYQSARLIHESLLSSEDCSFSSREIQVLNAIRDELGWCVVDQNHFHVTLVNDMGGTIRLRLRRNCNGSLVSLKSYWDDPTAGRYFLEVRCRHVPAKRIANELFFQVCRNRFPMFPAHI